MVPDQRNTFNQHFSDNKYAQLLSELNKDFESAIDFRVAETPVIIDSDCNQQMLDTCEYIIDTITHSNFTAQTDAAIPPNKNVPNQTAHPHFLAFDFGICLGQKNEIVPQLIEMQGFPSLFGYQVLLDDAMRSSYKIPAPYSAYYSGLTKNTYLQKLQSVIVGNHDPKHVVLLEIKPHTQKTRIDFYATAAFTGITIVCITDIIKEDNKLFYKNSGGEKIEIKRIYNRIIFDELDQMPANIKDAGRILFENLLVEWAGHPNWFYRISKFTMPLLQHPNIPASYYINELASIPEDLENYVLKPLFSFAGAGVIIDVTKTDIENLPDPANWMLQKKVDYAPIIKTPTTPAKVEIRLLYLWEEGAARPFPAINIARLSKGKMIGVRYNQNETWVGGSIAYAPSNSMITNGEGSSNTSHK
ncbi:MAG: hypothetical protein RL099_401 [Bacteroidota bacterium]